MSIASAVRHTHTHTHTHTPGHGTVRYAGTLVGMLACCWYPLWRERGRTCGRAVVVVQVDFGGDTGGVDWLCSVPKVPATVLGAYTATVPGYVGYHDHLHLLPGWPKLARACERDDLGRNHDGSRD